MKKGLLIFLGVIVFIFAALAITPFFFKDEIKQKVDSELAKTIDAKILFNADDISLSLFRNFPNLTISIDNLGIIGQKEGFKGDTLFSASSFRVVTDIMSVISGDKIKVKGIYLIKPYILTKFTKEGLNSWDFVIATPEDTTQKAPAEPSNFAIAIEEWKIEDGTIIYEDQSLPMYTELRHINHKGSGEMLGDVFTMDTKTTSPEFFLSYDNVTYFNKYKLDADAKLSMDLAKSEYRFMKNKFLINDFAMHFDGLIAMPTDDISMDLKFAADETDFKTLLSLVPAIYTKDFEHVKTDGKVAFDGWVKGIFNDNTMPGFGLNLVVNNAMMQYPNFTPVSNIGIDMHVINNDGVIDNTIIDLKKFNMDMGKNPIRARAFVQGLGPADIDANIKATINLADINQMYPIEGTTLKGIYSIDLNAKGTYNEAKHLMPKVDAKMSLKDGFIKSNDVPFPLENMNLTAVAKSNGDMASSSFLLEGFKMILDGEPFEMRAYVENFDNMKYDVNMKGAVDLTKLTKVYPMEGMTLAGRIVADISTKGLMSDVEAGKYDKTSTSGTMSVTDFKYVSTDMPQGMTLSSANFSLTPERMNIANMDGYLGKSDISIKGYFANYMGYMFGKQDTVIRGNMTLISKNFDVNEWMTEDSAAAAAPGEEEPMTVFEVPKNINFVFTSKMQKVLYDNLILTEFAGDIIMKNGILKMDKLGFNTLGGQFLTNATYNTQNMKEPKFEYDLKITDLDLKQAYKSFDMMKKYASAAENMDGKFSMELQKIYGVLGQDMMPIYKTVNGSGKAMISSAQIKDNKVLKTVGTLTKMKNVDPMKIQDLLIRFKIVDGNLIVDPFDIKAGDFKMNMGGQQSLEGNLDYLLKMDVPAGAVGETANSAIGALTGNTSSGNKNIKMDFKIKGTVTEPKVSLAGSSVKEQAKEAIKDAVEDRVNAEADKIKKEAEDKVNAEKERLKKEADDKLAAEKERLRKEAEDKAKAEADKAVKDGVKDLKKKLPFGK